MVEIPTKIMLFISSYSPLFFITALINLSDYIVVDFTYPFLFLKNFDLFNIQIALSILLILLSIASVCWVKSFLNFYADKGAEPSPKIENIQKKDSDVMAYIVTYLIPFLGIEFNNTLLTLSFILFITLVGYIYITSDLFYINPIFNVFKYHIYEIEVKDKTKKSIFKILISYRKDNIVGNVLSIINLEDNIYLEIKK